MRIAKWKAVEATKMVGMNPLLFAPECEDTVYPWLPSVIRVLMDD